MGACQPQTSNYSCSLKTPLTTNPHITRFPLEGYILDVLWGQRIQVVSTSEFHEYWCFDMGFIFFLPPPFSAGPQKWLVEVINLPFCLLRSNDAWCVVFIQSVYSSNEECLYIGWVSRFIYRGYVKKHHQSLTAAKIKYENIKNRYCSALIFQEGEFLTTKYTTLKLNDCKKFQFSNFI